MSAYMEGLEAHLEATSPKSDKRGDPQISDMGRLRRFHEARRASRVANDG